MCKYCEFDGEYGEYFVLNNLINVPDTATIAIETLIASYLRILKDENGNYMLLSSVPYEDEKGNAQCGSAGCIIKYCPFCGRKLQQEIRYHVEADWIHPHKDSRGEYLDDLTYEQAEAVRKQWVKDKIHKNVTMSKSELPFQGEGGNHGNQNTDKSDKG